MCSSFTLLKHLCEFYFALLPAETQTSRKAEEAEVMVVTNAGDPDKYSVSSLYYCFFREKVSSKDLSRLLTR